MSIDSAGGDHACCEYGALGFEYGDDEGSLAARIGVARQSRATTTDVGFQVCRT